MATYTSNYGWTKPGGSDNVDISVLNNNLDDQDSTIHDAFLNMAPPFSESSTYAVDDIVLYGTGLYKCHTAVVTPGSWTGSTNWQVYKLSEGGSGGGGTSNYNQLTNKPQINGVTLIGNKTTSDLGLQSELTFDNVPTDGSNNPVKSGGVYDSEKDIYAVMGQMGAKNLNSYPYVNTTRTTNNITFTDNGDGTITANGTATADAYFTCHSREQGEANDLIIPNGRYILTGCPLGGGTSTYNLTAARTYNSSFDMLGRDIGDGALFVANGDDFSANEVNIQLNIFIKKGQTVSNLTFKPMLRLASDIDDTYQPYAKTNRELTDEIATKTDKLTNTDSFYGTCSTAADVAEKVVTLVNADNFSLRAGVTVTVKFSATNTAQNPTINVNGTGAKSVWYYTGKITTGSLWSAGTVNIPSIYTYDGTYWVWMGRSYDTNTTYSAMSTAELTTGTETTLRTVRADYLKTGINQLISVKVPDAPTADGTYNLSVTVVNGTPTYSWVSTS